MSLFENTYSSLVRYLPVGSFIISNIPITKSNRTLNLVITIKDDLWVTLYVTIEGLQASLSFNSRKEILSDKEFSTKKQFDVFKKYLKAKRKKNVNH